MVFASQPYRTGLCNRHCEPLLKCPPGSHISGRRRSCVWHGRDGFGSRTRSSAGGLLSSILGTPSTPGSPVVESAPSSSRFFLPTSSSVAEQAPINPARTSALEDYLRERQNQAAASEYGEFGGGYRRRRYSYGRRRSHSRYRRRRRRSSGYRRRRRSSGRRRH